MVEVDRWRRREGLPRSAVFPILEPRHTHGVVIPPEDVVWLTFWDRGRSTSEALELQDAVRQAIGKRS